MSAMSASSPPAGLMPLSLISEHKTGVQQLPRTPEKMSPAPSAPQPLGLKIPSPGVSNGMEMVSQPPPPFSHPPLPDATHPAALVVEPAPSALPLSTHLPNLPSGSKAGAIPATSPVESASTVEEKLSSVVEPTPDHPPESNTLSEARLPSAVALTVVSPVAVSLPAATPAPLIFEATPLAVPPRPHIEVPTPPPNPIVAEGATASFSAVRPSETSDVKPVPERAHDNVAETPDATAALEPAHPTAPAEKKSPVAEPPVAPPPTQTAAAAPPIPEPVAAASTPASKPKRTPKPKPEPEKKTLVKETAVEKDGGAAGKPRRKRLPTQPYQSPIPELNLIAKISKIDKTPSRLQEDKLIVFYRNEFLAVRNAEGSYYVCQAMQNIYKSSSKIKIRWLSQDPNGVNYSPDFYDHTEFDCILTNLNLQRVGKDQFKLPEVEAKRTDSILKRAIDIEKGIADADESAITEEHPDGIDLSLYRNEEQLKKRKKKSKKGTKGADAARRARAAKLVTEPAKKLPTRGGKRKLAASPVASRRVTGATKKMTSVSAVPSATVSTTKKDTLKKDDSVGSGGAKSTTKRKATAAATTDSKRSRRDLSVKTKSGAAAASSSGGASSKPPASSTLRRPTRNSK